MNKDERELQSELSKKVLNFDNFVDTDTLLGKVIGIAKDIFKDAKGKHIAPTPFIFNGKDITVITYDPRTTKDIKKVISFGLAQIKNPEAVILIDQRSYKDHKNVLMITVSFMDQQASFSSYSVIDNDNLGEFSEWDNTEKILGGNNL